MEALGLEKIKSVCLTFGPQPSVAGMENWYFGHLSPPLGTKSAESSRLGALDLGGAPT